MLSLSNTSQEIKEPKYANKGYIRGTYVQSLAMLPTSLASLGILNGMKKLSQLTPADSVEIKKAAQEGLKRTGLYKKGVRTYTIQESSILNQLKEQSKNLFKKAITREPVSESVINNYIENAKNAISYNRKDVKALMAIREEILLSRKSFAKFLSKQPKDFRDTILSIGAKISGLQYKEGSNAAFLPHANKIILPSKSLQTSVFHEMGHALNANGGVLLKTLQKMRPMAKIVPAIVLTLALLNKRKTTDEKLENNSLKNRVQNVKDGIKKNAGIITAASMLPMVLEEGIASIRGQGVAKKLIKEGLLSKKLLNKIRLTNLGGFATYTLGMVGAAFATKIAIDVKDKIQANYEQKKLAKFQAKQAKLEAKNK